MKKFVISGTMNIGEKRKFVKEVDAATENAARQKVYALLGSQNGLTRSRITIEKVEAG